MLNVVALVGRLTRPAELRYLDDEKVVASFTLAVDNPFKKDDASFIRCQCWNKTAEVLSKYTDKGSLVGISGRIQTRAYEDRDKNKRTATEVIADRVQFLDTRKKDEPAVAEEDVPF